MKSKIEKIRHLKRAIKIHNLNIKLNDFDCNQYSILDDDDKELIIYWLKDDYWYEIGTTNNGNGVTSMIEHLI